MTHPALPVAIVTGGGSGIGLAAARMLAREGRRIVLVGRDQERLLAAASGFDTGCASCCPADVGTEAGCIRAIEHATSLGRLDVVINNAGWTPLKSIGQVEPDEAVKIFAVNAIGPVLMTILALRAIRSQQGTCGSGAASRPPCIVHVSSLAATDPFPGLGVYGAAKAAVNTLAMATAREEPWVRSFAVAPGAVETPLLRSIFSAEDLPRERCLSPEDVARVILDCVLGAYDHQNGRTIEVPSP